MLQQQETNYLNGGFEDARDFKSRRSSEKKCHEFLWNDRMWCGQENRFAWDECEGK